MLDLHRLRLLRELQQRGTIAAVAEALSYSPSTISQQLGTLEREAGVALLVPDGRRVRLTTAGQALAESAADLLDLEERARGALESARPGPTTVRVSVFQSAAISLVPGALTLLAERRPQLRVEVAELAPEIGLAELAARGFDIVVAEQYPGHTREFRPGLERVRLGADPIRLALPPDEPPADLHTLADRAWVMEPLGTAARQWAVQQCRAAGFEPDVRYEAGDLIAHVRLIAAGHAFGMLPDLLWAGEPPIVQLRELPGAPHREIFAATRSSATGRGAIQAVLAALADRFAASVRVQLGS